MTKKPSISIKNESPESQGNEAFSAIERIISGASECENFLQLGYSIVEEVDFLGSELSEFQSFKTDFNFCDFNGVDFSDSNFNECKFEQCSFLKSILVRSSFYKCEIENANFDYSNLTRAQFLESSFKGGSFNGANLTTASFSRCDLRGIDITRAKTDGVELIDCIFDDELKFIVGIEIKTSN